MLGLVPRAARHFADADPGRGHREARARRCGGPSPGACSARQARHSSCRRRRSKSKWSLRGYRPIARKSRRARVCPRSLTCGSTPRVASCPPPCPARMRLRAQVLRRTAPPAAAASSPRPCGPSRAPTCCSCRRPLRSRWAVRVANPGRRANESQRSVDLRRPVASGRARSVERRVQAVPPAAQLRLRWPGTRSNSPTSRWSTLRGRMQSSTATG